MNSVDTAIGQGTKEPSPKWRERLRTIQGFHFKRRAGPAQKICVRP